MKESRYRWIVEVLDDINQFSIENKLNNLSLAIEKAKAAALTEVQKNETSNYDAVMKFLFPKSDQSSKN